jgi:hypothetical protein
MVECVLEDTFLKFSGVDDQEALLHSVMLPSEGFEL